MSDIRNAQGIWINSELFRSEGNAFIRQGYYCADPIGSPAYNDYWEYQWNLCVNGCEIGGARITGDHYFYLNFCPIQRTIFNKTPEQQVIKAKVARKSISFADFWDGDYEYYHIINIAANGCTPDEFSKLMLDSKPTTLSGGKHVIVGKSRRKGFEQPHSEVIITPFGETTMGDIKIGDIVCTPTGTAKVIDKFPQGLKDVYEITFHDDRKVRCGLDHLWKIQNSRGIEKIVKTEFFLDKTLVRNKGKRSQYYGYHIPQNEATKFEHKDLPIHPYILGLIIGDGSVTQGSLLFSTNDEEILNYIKEILPEYTIKKKDTPFQYSISSNSSTNPIMRSLRELNLRCRAENKFIPDIYKYSSIEQRMELLRGLMDTDGTSSPNGSCRFCTSSPNLRKDVEYLCRSLGIKVKTHLIEPGGNSYAKLTAYCLNIVTDLPIFKLKRKLKNVRQDRKYNFNKIAIKSVKKLDYQEESSCILIDCPNHLYLTRDFIVTHNSYKNGSKASHQYTFDRNSLAMLCAYSKKYLYPKGIMTMSQNYCNFINEHTGFAKRRLINKQDHIKSGFIEKVNGVDIEKGFKSEIMAITFKDNPDAARGKDAGLILMEEVGDWLDMKSAYAAILPCVQDGDIITGQLVAFGTGADTSGSTADFMELFNNPEPYNLLPFQNIWDDNAEATTCGYFFPVYQNMVGFIDEQGNSNKIAAKERELKERARIAETAKDKETLTRYITEFPFNGREAFSLSSGNIYPTSELIKQLGFLQSSVDGDVKGTYGTLKFNGPKVEFQVNESLRPADFPVKDSAKAEGCVVIWEMPVANPPFGLYIAGNDPYDQDTAPNSMSLGSTIIMKRAMPGFDNHDKIVAEYTGRPASAKEFYETTRRLLIFYNALCLYENEKNGIKTYFEQQKSLQYLAYTPTVLKSNANTKINRIYGQHMTTGVKSELEVVARDWLNESVGEGKTNINQIYSQPILKELISYNPESGNYDRHIALLLVLAQALQMYRIVVDPNKKKIIDPFLTRKHFI